jgi:dipeptidyl aminopeptidase/acylaminoacyl peptidase
MTNGRIVVIASLLGAARAMAQAAPSTDVYLAPITRTSDDSSGITVATPVNITRRQGYDNQPAFTPDGRAVFYTSTRQDGQADIYRYDIATRRTTRVTSTPESEYSATFMPGAKRFSVVRVERDSTQRLWSFAMDGSDPRLVLRTIKPVGYHAWLDATHVALFVLGRPATLQVATLGTEHADTLARDIGRSLSTMSAGRVSFTTRTADSAFTMNVVRLAAAAKRASVSGGTTVLPPGAEYVVWMSPDVAITASGTKLYVFRRGAVDHHWAQIADFATNGLSHITRLAISADGRWLAMVADDGR